MKSDEKEVTEMVEELSLSNTVLTREKLFELDQLLPLSETPISTAIPEWCKFLRSNYNVFLDEYESFIKKASAPLTKVTTGDLGGDSDVFNKWQTIILRLYDRDTDYASMFPNTMKILNKNDRIKTIIFSTFAPGAKLIPHRGVSRTVLRYHLGLKVPHDRINCYLTLWDTKDNFEVMYRHSWEVGKDIIFDDNYLHTAVNPTTDPRTVLLLDIKREFNNEEHRKLSDLIMNYAFLSVNNDEIVKINKEAAKAKIKLKKVKP